MKRNARRIAVLLLTVFLFIGYAAPLGFAEWNGSRQEAVKGVVSVLASASPVSRMNSWGTGSGFGVGQAGKPTKYFVTNRHVVTDENGNICDYVYIMLEDGALSYYITETSLEYQYDDSKMIRCKVLYPKNSDPEYPDVAIIEAERVVTERIALPLKSGWNMTQGDTIYAMGFPGSADDAFSVRAVNNSTYLQEVSASTSGVTVTQGVISRTVSIHDEGDTTAFQHTAESNHGNSGGPLVTEDGYVVGIHTFGFNRADNGVSEYRGALYVDYAMQKLDALGLSYDKYEKTSAAAASAFSSDWIWIAAAAAGVVAVVVTIVYLLTDKPKPPRPAPAPAPAGRPAYRLQGLNGIYAGKRYPIDRTIRIGRDPARNNLVYPASEKRISGEHCTLLLRNGDLYIQDSNSKNGTFVNGRRLDPGAAMRLQVNDIISLAGEEQRFKIDISHHQSAG